VANFLRVAASYFFLIFGPLSATACGVCMCSSFLILSSFCSLLLFQSSVQWNISFFSWNDLTLRIIYLTNFVAFAHFLYEEEGNLSVDPQCFFCTWATWDAEICEVTGDSQRTLKLTTTLLKGFRLGRDLQLSCNVIDGLKILLCFYSVCDATRENILACEMSALTDHTPLDIKFLFAS